MVVAVLCVGGCEGYERVGGFGNDDGLGKPSEIVGKSKISTLTYFQEDLDFILKFRSDLIAKKYFCLGFFFLNSIMARGSEK